jgi:long-chain fatty acid transport protein
MRRALAAAAVFAASFVLVPRVARATSVEEFPDNGSEQEGRGGAWVARASDPLAAFYNPAGLAGQPTRVTLQANISTQNTCFTRVKATNDTTGDGVNPGAGYPQVCNSGSFFPDPQLAFTYRLTDRIGLGIAVLAPSAVGNVSWPEFINGATPSPQRYLLISNNTVLLTPTIGIGWEAVDNLRLGASFVVGTAPSIDVVNASPAQNTASAVSPTANDIRNELKVSAPFVPGFVLGALWSPTPELDVAGWYKWMSDVNAKGDVITAYNYFTNPVATKGDTSQVYYGDTAEPYCYTLPPNKPPPAGAPPCGSGNNATVKVPIPMEAKLGVRYHKLRSGVPYDARLRDPIAQDVFDIEADFTWANDSAFDYLQIRFPGDATGTGTIPANPGIPAGLGAYLPPNADVRHHFRDVFGVRLGGDYNVLPDQLAVRAGAFFESKAADSTYQDIDFDAAMRVGLAVGGTYRIRLGAEKRQAIELMLAYGHVFFGSLDNSDPNGPGQPALTGQPCQGGLGNAQSGCQNGATPYRTPWPANLGTITSSIDVINVGASYKF